MLVIFIITTLIYGTTAVVYIKAPCPQVQGVDNFNISEYAKTGWYEIARYPNDIQRKGDCSSIRFSNVNDELRYKISEVMDGQVISTEGYWHLAPDAGNTGVIDIHSVNVTQEEIVDSMPIHILDIDYDNYALLYECKYDETTKTRHDYAWIFSKTKILEGSPRIAMDNFIKLSGFIDNDKFVWGHFTEETCKGLL